MSSHSLSMLHLGTFDLDKLMISLKQKQQSSEGDLNKKDERDNNKNVVYLFKVDLGNVSQNLKAVESKETRSISRTIHPPRCYLGKKFKCPNTHCHRSYPNEYNLSFHENEKKYTCEICGKIFCDMKLLKKHLLTHSTEELLTIGVCHGEGHTTQYAEEKKKTSSRPACTVCGITVKTELLLEEHMRTHGVKTALKCEKVGTTQMSEKLRETELTYREHMRTHGVEKALKCEKVPSLLMMKNHTDEHAVKKASTGNVFEEYLKTHEVKEADKICEKGFNSEANLKKDLGTYTMKKKYICGKWLTFYEDLRGHTRTQMEEKPLCLCEFCGKFFNSGVKFNKHVRIHTVEKPYLCDFCGKSFRQPKSLWQHRRTHRAEHTHICERCGKGFITKYGLTRHLKRHSGELPYMCEFCGKRLKFKNSLKYHMHTHNEGEVSFKKSHTCICGKSFIWRWQLNVHKRKHTGEKPFICNICGKRFGYAADRIRHEKIHFSTKCRKDPSIGQGFHKKCNNANSSVMETHTGKMPYVNNLSGESSSLSTARKRRTQRHLSKKEHMVETHQIDTDKSKNSLSSTQHNTCGTGVKRHICPYCNKGFQKKYALTTHLRKHTGEKPYECDFCGSSFSLLSNVKRHVRSQHLIKNKNKGE